ncbi:hypothetical protein, partial [Klebsiella oxytoca]|uniref:hypothetical protein n=1 Tax=Klebsiella oxytoca TaxID=571 RepID=UPI001CA36A9E
ESRHGNPYLIIHGGHLNLAQSGHYNFATTKLVRVIIVMLNSLHEYFTSWFFGATTEISMLNRHG